MPIEALLSKARPALASRLTELDRELPGHTLVFAISNGVERAHVVNVSAADFSTAWRAGAQHLQRWAVGHRANQKWLRVDCVDRVTTHTWKSLTEEFARTKRNYFEQGISLDADLSTAMLAQELGANAILYDSQETECVANAVNLKNFSKRRFGRELHWPTDPDTAVWTFTTRGIFTDGSQTHRIENNGRHQGYREVPNWNADFVRAVVVSATDYLARQVKESGQYDYGWFPCFDRPIPTYNALRHASSSYALLEAWELTRADADKAAIDRALSYLTKTLIKNASLPDGQRVAFLVDVGDEIKLGGNAVCLLALVKYTDLTNDQQYLALLERLALGILHMQDPRTGRFLHVLRYPDLSLVAEHRIIYYDGEAAFGLMRLYGLTRDERWLVAVEKAFDYFIAAKHWRAHDHWLSYCVNEITLYRPEARYYQFGLDNVREHLDFVLERITTYPTLLELMMAAQKMIERLRIDPQHAQILQGFDLAKFHQALEVRARYLLNGFFWPELAMFFKNPGRILGSFFIRHHSYRVRIDDVEHYLSGYVAYWQYAMRAYRSRGSSLSAGES